MDPLSWEIIGMSAKEDTSTAIGQFGSGLKYAIAVLLRNEHEFEIVTRDNDVETIYKFDTSTKYFRGKEFQIVTCNGKELGITTDMGKHWELWMAYRELVSNTMDEGGIHMSSEEAMPDGTSILVRGEDFYALLAMHNEYFIGDREVLHDTTIFNIYNGTGKVFYRGVRVGKLDKQSFYDYESISQMDLTEDRTIRNPEQLKRRLGNMYTCYCEDRSLIKRVITLAEKHFEYDLDWEWSWSETFSECVREIWLTKPTTLNDKIAKLFKTKQNDTTWETQDFTEDQEILLNAAKDFMLKAGYEITSPVRLVINKDTNNLGFYHENIIYLTQKAFDKGLYELICGLFRMYMSQEGFGLTSLTSSKASDWLIEELITTKRRQLKIAF